MRIVIVSLCLVLVSCAASVRNEKHEGETLWCVGACVHTSSDRKGQNEEVSVEDKAKQNEDK